MFNVVELRTTCQAAAEQAAPDEWETKARRVAEEWGKLLAPALKEKAIADANEGHSGTYLELVIDDEFDKRLGKAAAEYLRQNFEGVDISYRPGVKPNPNGFFQVKGCSAMIMARFSW